MRSSERLDKKGYPNQDKELNSPPEKRTQSEINIAHIAYDRAANKTQASVIAKATGCKGSYSFMRQGKAIFSIQQCQRRSNYFLTE